MFGSLDIMKIITMVSVGLVIFLIALGIFYIIYKYRLKNPKEYDEKSDEDILSPYHYMNKKSEKKLNKKLVKTNKILLKEYKKQYNRKEITLEQYQFLTSSLLGIQETDKKEEIVEPIIEEVQENNVMNELNDLFVKSEVMMEEYLKTYHFNSLEIVYNIHQKNNIVHLINKKKIILNKINQISIYDLEKLSEIDGLKENREGIIELIKKELNDISLLEQNLWDDEFCSIYYLEDYVYTYLPEDILNQQIQYEEEESSIEEVNRTYNETEIEREINRSYQEISHNEK